MAPHGRALPAFSASANSAPEKKRGPAVHRHHQPLSQLSAPLRVPGQRLTRLHSFGLPAALALAQRPCRPRPPRPPCSPRAPRVAPPTRPLRSRLMRPPRSPRASCLLRSPPAALAAPGTLATLAAPTALAPALYGGGRRGWTRMGCPLNSHYFQLQQRWFSFL